MSQWDLSQPYLYFNREGTDNRLWWHSYPLNMCTGMLSGLTIITLPLDCPEFCIGNPRFAPLLNWQSPTLRGEDLSRVGLHLIWGRKKKRKDVNFLPLDFVTAALSPANWLIYNSSLFCGTALPHLGKLRHRHHCPITSQRYLSSACEDNAKKLWKPQLLVLHLFFHGRKTRKNHPTVGDEVSSSSTHQPPTTTLPGKEKLWLHLQLSPNGENGNISQICAFKFLS